MLLIEPELSYLCVDITLLNHKLNIFLPFYPLLVATELDTF